MRTVSVKNFERFSPVPKCIGVWGDDCCPPLLEEEGVWVSGEMSLLSIVGDVRGKNQLLSMPIPTALSKDTRRRWGRRQAVGLGH